MADLTVGDRVFVRIAGRSATATVIEDRGRDVDSERQRVRLEVAGEETRPIRFDLHADLLTRAE